MAFPLIEGALSFIGVTLLSASWHHAMGWRMMAATLATHGMWPATMIRPIQAATIAAQALVGAGCLYVIAVRPHHALAVAWWTLSCAVLLGIGFLSYVRALRRRGGGAACGCFYVAAGEHASASSYVPSAALTLSAAVGLSLLVLAAAPDDPPLGLADVVAHSRLGSVVLLILGVALSVLVQCLGLVLDRDDARPSDARTRAMP